MKECKPVSFKGQTIFVGMDVHKKSWRVTERHAGCELKTYSMSPSVEGLVNRLKTQYPEAEYRTAYEAGFCGFWIHRELNDHGIVNIVVSPADIPTTDKERARKNDVRDSRKLARELEKDDLTAIYIPSPEHLELRDLVRRETQIINNMTRCKNRIKGYLLLYDYPVSGKNWSGSALNRLAQMVAPLHASALISMIAELRWLRQHRLELILAQRRYLERTGRQELQQHLVSIPGIGFRVAMVIMSEIWDINRFRDESHLATYVGLAPQLYGSGAKEQVIGPGQRKHRLLQSMLVESAWRAIGKDMGLRSKFGQLQKRTAKNKALFSIARKLLARIRAVWMQNRPYRLDALNL